MPVAAVEVTGEGLLRCFTGRRDSGLPPKPSYLDAPPEISPFPRFSLIELVFELTAGFSRRTLATITSRTDRSSSSSSAIFSNYGRKRSFKKRITTRASILARRIPLISTLLHSYSKNQRILRISSFLCHSDSGFLIWNVKCVLANRRGVIFHDAMSKRRKCSPKWKQGPKRRDSK